MSSSRDSLTYQDANTNDLAIVFTTTKSNSLLVYNYGRSAGGRSDFLAVELVEGRPRLSWGGTRTAISKIQGCAKGCALGCVIPHPGFPLNVGEIHAT